MWECQAESLPACAGTCECVKMHSRSMMRLSAWQWSRKIRSSRIGSRWADHHEGVVLLR